MVNDKIKCFGYSNIITIILVGASVIFNYATLQSKIDMITDNLEEETIERKVEDEKIRREMNIYYQRNNEQHLMIIKELKMMREDLTYHLGKHAGEESR